MNLAPSPSVKQVSESNHLFELKRTEGKHYWLCVWVLGTLKQHGWILSFFLCCLARLWELCFLFCSGSIPYHLEGMFFFKRSCMVIVLIKAFVYNCTIMPPKSSGIQSTTRPQQFSTCYCWAEVQKTNSPSRLPLLSHATIEKKLLSFSLTQSTHSHLLWWHGKSWFVLNNDCSNVRLEISEN